MYASMERVSSSEMGAGEEGVQEMGCAISDCLPAKEVIWLPAQQGNQSPVGIKDQNGQSWKPIRAEREQIEKDILSQPVNIGKAFSPTHTVDLFLSVNMTPHPDCPRRRLWEGTNVGGLPTVLCRSFANSRRHGVREVCNLKVHPEHILSSCAPFPMDGLEARILRLACIKLSPLVFTSF
jgi:hypothetical protein